MTLGTERHQTPIGYLNVDAVTLNLIAERPGSARALQNGNGCEYGPFLTAGSDLRGRSRHERKPVRTNADQGATAEAAGATGAASMPFPENSQERHMTMQQIKANSDMA